MKHCSSYLLLSLLAFICDYLLYWYVFSVCYRYALFIVSIGIDMRLFVLPLRIFKKRLLVFSLLFTFLAKLGFNLRNIKRERIL